MMARPLRIEYPGAFYHVMNRGNAGEDIFISERDKEKFTEYLRKSVERFSISIHTYCLLSNHYHVLIETPQPNLSLAIQWLNVSYAAYHNRKRHRSGHLFQGRFKSTSQYPTIPWPRPGFHGLSSVSSSWEVLHRQDGIPVKSRSPRRRLYEPEARAGHYFYPVKRYSISLGPCAGQKLGSRKKAFILNKL